MPTDFDLLVLGDANPDLILHGGDVVPAFGQAERLVDEARLTVGGSGAILACGAARLGLRVALCAVVGADLFGEFMLRGLGERGVDTSGVIVDRTVSTGISVIMSGEADRAILTMPGTVSTLRPDQVDPSLLERSRHVHVSAYFIQRSIRSGLTELFDDVHANGGTTSVDPNWDPEGSWDDGLLDLLLKTDVFLPNAIEAARIARTSSIDDAVRALCARASLVVVKDGDRGALLGGEGEWIRAPGFATDVVDTTGAGDAFDAGFLAAWLGDAPLTRALRIANACGSLSTRALGGVDAQVTMQEAVDAIERGSAA